MADDQKYKGLEIPKKGKKDDIKKWMDTFFSRESSYRRELEDEDFFKPCAYYENHQWLQKSKGDSRRAPRFTDWPDDPNIPKPVSNEIMPAVDNEVSRVARRNSDIEVQPRGVDPDAKAGAKRAEDIAKDNNDRIGWPRIRRDFCFNDILYGTAGLVSWIETSYRPDKTVRIGVSGARRCVGTTGVPELGIADMPSCGCTLASEAVPYEQGRDIASVNPSRVVPTMDPNLEEPKGYKAARCPNCGGRLEEFTATMAEADGKDFFGRALGKDVPLQEAACETVSGWEMFFENEGRGVTADTCTEFGLERVKSLKWIREHFNKNLDQLQPDDPMKILERFPWQGEYSASNRGAYSVAPGSTGQRHLYNNHAIVRWAWTDPDRDNPNGRYIVTSGLDSMVILEDGDLYVEDDLGNKFPKVLLKTARCFIRDGTIWGKGFAAYVISEQNRINMRLSQIVQLAERMGIISITATRGMRLSREWLKGLIGTVLRWEVDTAVPDAKPDVQTGQLQFGQWLEEIRDARETIKDRLGINDVEVGGGAESMSGIARQLAAEKSSERRQQREQEIVKVYEAIQGHQLKLIQHYYLENEGRKYKSKVGTAWQEREFKGLDIAGQTDVKIREMPGFDQTLAGKQTLIESVSAGQIQLMTPYAKREFAKTIGAPTAVMDEDNVQIDAAERKFQDWRQLGEVPAVDPNLDNHAIHWDTYGRLMLDHESVELTKAVDWGKALKAIAGWESSLPTTAALAAQVSAMADASGKTREETWAIQGQVFQQLGRAIPPTGTPPPDALEDLVWWIWQNRLIARGVITPGQAPPQFETFARFQAVREAHGLYARGTAAQLGVPPPQAPGTQPQPGMAPPMPPEPGLQAPQPQPPMVQ